MANMDAIPPPCWFMSLAHMYASILRFVVACEVGYFAYILFFRWLLDNRFVVLRSLGYFFSTIAVFIAIIGLFAKNDIPSQFKATIWASSSAFILNFLTGTMKKRTFGRPRSH